MFTTELGFSFTDTPVTDFSDTTGVASAATLEKPVRGLVLHPHSLAKYLCKGKSMEVRNFYCRCVKPGDELYLLGSDSGTTTNKHGVACMHVAARMCFVENVTIRHEDMHLFTDSTLLSDEEYTDFRSSWKTDKGSCVGWRLNLLEVLSPALFLPWGNQALWVRTILCC
jgi:hypothetical protein